MVDLKPLSGDEIATLRMLTPWVTIVGGGYILILAGALWWIFSYCRRLEDTEKGLKTLVESNPLTEKQLAVFMENCQLKVSSRIDKENTDLHLKFIEETSKFRETQCHMLGEMKQISSSLDSLISFKEGSKE